MEEWDGKADRGNAHLVTIRAGRREDFPRLAEIELDAFVVWQKPAG